jgi:hypothetical protein
MRELVEPVARMGELLDRVTDKERGPALVSTPRAGPPQLAHPFHRA